MRSTSVVPPSAGTERASTPQPETNDYLNNLNPILGFIFLLGLGLFAYIVIYMALPADGTLLNEFADRLSR